MRLFLCSISLEFAATKIRGGSCPGSGCGGHWLILLIRLRIRRISGAVPEMIMEQGIERVLCVSRVDAVAGGFMPAETRVWGEEELSGLAWLQAAKDWQKLRGWVLKMDNLLIKDN